MHKRTFSFPENDNIPKHRQLAIVGPTLYVRIGFEPDYHLRLARPPLLPEKLYPALLDTGATLGAIDAGLARSLGLTQIDEQDAIGIHGISTFPVYMAQMYISALDFTIFGSFKGVELAVGNNPHLAIIGRNFLMRFRLTYEGHRGQFTLEQIPTSELLSESE